MAEKVTAGDKHPYQQRTGRSLPRMDESSGQDQGEAWLMDAGVGTVGCMEESGEEEVQVAGEGQAIVGTDFGGSNKKLKHWGSTYGALL